MKSLVISLGGLKAARVADIFTYYSRRLESHLTVEVFDTRGKEIIDATVEVSRDFDAVLPGGMDKATSVAYLLKVSKEGFQPIRKTLWIGAEEVATARVVLVRERSHYLITTVFLTLLAPFVWAGLKYFWGFVAAVPPANYLIIAIILFLFQLGGAVTGIRILGKRLEPVLNNRYYSGVIAILVGELLALLSSTFLLGIILDIIGITGILPPSYTLETWDVTILTLLIVILALAGLIIDQRLQQFLDKTRFSASLFVAFGAMVGGALSSYGNPLNFSPVPGFAGDASVLFPLIVFGFTLLWCYSIVSLLKKKELIRESNNLSEAVYSLLGVMLIAGLMPVITGMGAVLYTFLPASVTGALAGLILYFLVFGRTLDESEVSSVEKGAGFKKKYRFSTVSFSIDTVRSRLESLRFVTPENILFFDEPEKDPVSFFTTNIKDIIRKKITHLYRENLQDCTRLFSSCIIILDLRDNNLCELLPALLSFLREEYSIPIYTVVISTQDRLNRNWLKKVLDRSDAVIPVDYRLFDDVLYLDRFLYQDGDVLSMEDVYEEGCIVELIRRFGPFLEIGERDSPTGLDISHVDRILSRKRIPPMICNDVTDVVPPPDQNISTFGYFLLNTKKCRGINLELAMGEYLSFALKNPLWKIEQPTSATRAVVVVRGSREHIVTGLARRWIENIYDGLLIMTGDILADSGDTIEISILMSHIFGPVNEDPSSSSRCTEAVPKPQTSEKPGLFKQIWFKLRRKDIPGSDDAEERYRWGNPDSYTAIVKKYYRRSPLVRYRAVTIARDHPGAAEWEQAKSLCEWVRDNISYVSDPYDSEYCQLPDETLTNMGGDCDDQAILLASLLMNVGFRCSLVFCERHVYVATYLPNAPDTVRTYANGEWPDATMSRDWIGFDPTCSNCSFGELPEDDKMIETVAIIG
jgi:hypothetical protein